MATNHASPDTSANPTKDRPTCPERDARKGTHDDDSTDETNSVDAQQGNPPNHGLPTHSRARFLWDVPKDTPISELGDLYDQWRDESEQAEIGRWSE